MIPIEIRSMVDCPEGEIRRFAEHRMSFALDRFRNLQRVVLSVEDVNGPKGGPDKLCRVIAECASASVVIEEVQVTWQAAVARATRRLARKLARESERVKRSGYHRTAANASHAGRATIRRNSSTDPKLASN
jgi:ribosome-associated translation inhibitor RaiA